jgi:SAM-dependent MidA family methyltransferase
MNVHDELVNRISKRKAITFAEFMGLALYWPEGGYYSTLRSFGRSGDYFTSPLVHPIFGTLVGRQLQEVWELLDRPDPFWVLEAGAGNGSLACDILRSIREEAAGCFDSLKYIVLDPTGGKGLEHDLEEEFSSRIMRIRSSELPFMEFIGCVLCNELVDAFPVHRVLFQGGKLHEIYVGLDEHGDFTEIIGYPSTPQLEARFNSLGISLAEGYRTEVNLSLSRWLRQLAAVVKRGVALLIDYGYEGVNFYGQDRNLGTLSYYYNHVQTNNPYQRVGKQDITSHVEFTTLQRSALENGFTLLGNTTQKNFLYNLGFSHFINQITRQVSLKVSRDIEILVDQEGLGGFRVVGLGKDFEQIQLTGFKNYKDEPRQAISTEPFGYVLPLPHHLVNKY